MSHPVITPEKITKILQDYEKTDDVKLIKSEVVPGSDKGENYSSVVLACHVEAEINGGQSKSYHWIAKIPSDDPWKFKWVRPCRMEEKEVAFYNDLVPRLKSYLNQKGSGIELQLCPKIFAEFKEDTKPEECQYGSMVLLEHLRYNGFTEQSNSNRKAGFDMAHTKLVLEALADFHAVTYGYLKQKHGSLNDMVDKEPLFARDFIGADPPVELEAFKEQFAEQGIQSHLTLLSSFKDDKYEKLFKLFMEKNGNPTTYCEKLGSYKNFEFHVLCHGDPWFNNMLFRHEGDSPTGVCLLDNACTRWTTPAFDLAYLLFTSAAPELRQDHLQGLLEHYHQRFRQSLAEVGENPNVYSLESLKSDYTRCTYIGLLTAITMLPWTLAKKEDAFSFDDMKDFDQADEKRRNEMMEKVQASMQRTLAKEPMVAHRITTAFDEAIEAGYFKD
ncbi:uncharacterized protein LOC131883208 [Tigriopus californicus]|uniref:uncharacterized protein LOC131883208 n=1 Tax=Tigriopus californicus TaxID=6832 RepID=UPI0027DA0EFA|nr:uncharacterized protein LOC131883208 [Tigriopus californicus]